MINDATYHTRGGHDELLKHALFARGGEEGGGEHVPQLGRTKWPACGSKRVDDRGCECRLGAGA